MIIYSNMFGVVVSAILLSTFIDVQGRYVYRPDTEVPHKKIIATWEEAKQRCKKEGAILASPVYDDLVEQMKTSIGVSNHTTPYFIGMKATANLELIFVSVDGVLLENLPDGAQDMIDQLEPQDGDCLRMSRNNIQVVTCRSRLPYMCYYTEATSATTAVPTDCGSGYKLCSTGSCYKVHLEAKNWDDAQSICVSEGAYLAVINNEYEAKVIQNFAFTRDNPVWLTIGLRDFKSDGHWSSVHGDPIDQIFHVWSPTRSKDRHCGSFKWDGYVDDQFCGGGIPFICERLPQPPYA